MIYTELIILALFISGASWYAVYSNLYSPEARIKKLWNEIFEMTNIINGYEREDNVATFIITDPYKNQIVKKKKMINALLDYYFDSKEDEEYIVGNRPKL